jgi:superfamily I DNA/RNA helicase
VNVTPELLVGPAQSGKTRAAVRRSFEIAQSGERVIVLTLPNQRGIFLERLSKEGPTLGVEVTNLQNVAYRLLDRLGENRPVVLNPGRVALTARALEGVLGRAVGPGEARLYARAIAECKRHLVRPQPTGEPYQDALSSTFAAYEASLEASGVQDLDDVRLRAVRLLEGSGLSLDAHLIVDGYRALNPSELGAIRVLCKLAHSSLVTLPAGSPDTAQDAWAHPLRYAELESIAAQLGAKPRRLEARGKPWAGLPQTVVLEAHVNPVEEARATLRAIKRALLDGVLAHEIAVVIPNPVSSRVLEALGREYGVPIAPETQGSALETPEGRVLEAILGAPSRDYPTRDLRALAVLEPSLVRLAEVLEQSGVNSGTRAYSLVSRDGEALAALGRVRALAEPPESARTDELVSWFERVLERVLHGSAFLDTARVIAREAARLLDASGDVRLDGATFTDWVRSLLSSVPVPHPMSGRGVAVLGPEEASGRRFRRVFVMGAVDGAYRVGDGEDFFVPEEHRLALEQILAGVPGLPARLVGLEDSALYDVLTRADEVVTVSYPRAERGSGLRPHPRLASLTLEKLASSGGERVLTASPFELLAATTEREPHASKIPWRVRPRRAEQAAVLERSSICAVRAWAEAEVPAASRGSGLVSGELLRSWNARLRRARWRGDDAAPISVVPDDHRDRIQALAPQFRARLEAELDARTPRPRPSEVQLGYKASLDGLEIVLDGVRFRKNRDEDVIATEIYRVMDDPSDGYDAFMRPDRQREWWFAGWWLDRGVQVSFWAWNLVSEPRRVFGLDKPYAQRRLRESMAALETSRASLESGEISATPGFHCRECAHRDLCREAV